MASSDYSFCLRCGKSLEGGPPAARCQCSQRYTLTGAQAGSIREVSMVRAKFKVVHIGLTEGRDKQGQPCVQHTVTLQPVYSSNPAHENKAFWDATPAGKIELGIVNTAAGEQFELGAEFYVDFTPAKG
jgi:hypothetical protein